MSDCSARQDPVERWLPVVGFEGSYEVSDHGRVRSVDRVIEGGRWGRERRAGQIMAGSVDQKGYRQVTLRRIGDSECRKIHVLVLESFVGPRPPGYEGCHWDDDPTNNHLVNLRWDTVSANALDRVRNGRHEKASRTHCPRGHELSDLNNPPSHAKLGKRTCLACARAKDDARTRERRGEVVIDRYATADAHYRKIMSAHDPLVRGKR